MGFYIGVYGEYYEGDRRGPNDIEVPQRPSPEHVWQNNTWVVDPDAAISKKKLEIASTDEGMARICEDLIDVLVLKGTISIKDLPEDAQKKLTERKSLRSQIEALKK